MFSTDAYRRIAEVAFDYVREYHRPPKAHLADLLEDRLRRGTEEGNALRTTVADMQRLYPHLNAEYVLRELDHWVVVGRMNRDLRDAGNALSSGDIEGAQKALYGNPPVPPDTPGIWFSDTEAMLSFMNRNDDDEFTFGIETLDEKGIRPQRKTLSLLTAPKGRGKSWFLINVGIANRFLGKSVLHITLELSAKLTAQRYVQAATAMAAADGAPIRVPQFVRDSSGRFLRFDMEHETTPRVISEETRQSVIRKLRAQARRAPLCIKEFATGTLSTHQLKAYLDSLAQRDNFRPDVVIIDQAKNMKMNMQEIRLETGRVYIELRAIAQERNLAMVTVNQGNRRSSEVGTVFSNQTAEDWSIIGTCDTAMTYSQTEHERNMNLARLMVEHSRVARDHFIILLAQSYATGQFALRSIMFNDRIKAAVDAVTGQGEREAADD